MALLFESWLVEFVAVLAAIFIVIYTYFKWSFGYWEKRNVPFITPVFPQGTMENPLTRKKALGCWLEKNYKELKAKGYKHGGLFNFSSPAYIPIDPDYIKNIMQKDFQHFVDRGEYYNEKDDPVSAHLFAVTGEKWRNLRTKLTPTFTSGKMKVMFDTLIKCSNPMKKAMDDFSRNKTPVDIKEVVSSFTTDIIGSTAFGLECNSFESPDAEFRKHGKTVFDFDTVQMIKIMIGMANRKLANLLRITTTPKATADFFMQVIKDTVSYREQNNIVRKDMLQLLIDLKNEDKAEGHKSDGKSLTIEEVAAQAFVFFIAGYETSSTTMVWSLFELAMNPDLQEKVRDEINDVLDNHGGKITYEAITEMKYMNQVIDETLRKYPPLPVLTRKCVLDYKVPGTDLVIEKGTMVWISSQGLQNDPEYFPDPEKFDPERFNDANKKQRHPFTYIPFGEGPRVCIGLRFGVMQTKVGLTVLLKNYRFSVNKKTQFPIKMDPIKMVPTAVGSVWLDSEKIE